MPEIKEYSQRVDLQGPVREQRITADEIGGGQGYQALGRGLEYAGDAIYKRAEQDEISQATVDLSKAHVEFTKKLNDQVQQGNVNPEEFTRSLDEYNSQIGDNLSTRGGKEYFAKASAAMNTHFQETAIVASSELAAEKTQTNLKDTLSNYSSALMHDPSGHPMAKENFNSFVDSSVQGGNLPFAKGEELKQQGKAILAEGAIRGWMNLSPGGAKAQLEAGNWDQDLNSDMVKQLTTEADMHIHAARDEETRQRIEAERAKKEANNTIGNDFLNRMYKGQLTNKDILNSDLPAFGEDSKHTWLNILKTNTEGKAKRDNAVFKSMLGRIHAPDDDPSKITTDAPLLRAAVNGDIPFEDLQQLRGELVGRGTQEGKFESAQISTFMKTAEDNLVKSNPMMGIKDAQGEEQMARFQSEFIKKFQDGKGKGKSVDDMLNPDSPDYLGNLITKYKKSPSEIMQGNMKALQPKVIDPAIARKPNESAADYLKRTKKQ